MEQMRQKKYSDSAQQTAIMSLVERSEINFLSYKCTMLSQNETRWTMTYDSRNGFFGGVGIKLGIALLLICVNSSIHNILLKEEII